MDTLRQEKATFFREDRPVLFMAGFYNRFQNEERFMILTTQTNASVQQSLFLT